MTKQLTLNCDMGEGFGPWEMGDDKAIMPLIDAANIACGGHAGDPSTMRHCVELAKRHKTEIGAHVSYPDKQGLVGGPWTSAVRNSSTLCCIKSAHSTVSQGLMGHA